MKTITDRTDSAWRGVRVLLRTDLNVPVSGGVVTNDFRIKKALGTMQYLRERGARVIVIAHNGHDDEGTLRPATAALAAYLPAVFVSDTIGREAQSVVQEMRDGDIVVLENLRQVNGETANDEDFVRSLAALADVYVNDAFSVSHRHHASIVGVPRLLPSYAGLLMREEIKHLSEALMPSHPALCILGGAKFETKEPLIRKLLTIYDHLFIGGALANDVFRACGFEVGRSLVSAKPPRDDLFTDGRLLVPVDVVGESSSGSVRTAAADDVYPDEKIVDIGPKSVEELAPYIRDASFILWNGPMGVYEEGFDTWTHAIAEEVARSSAYTVVGGGDTIAAITELGVGGAIDFCSTGGGAMLAYLLDGTLPGIEALERAE